MKHGLTTKRPDRGPHKKQGSIFSFCSNLGLLAWSVKKVLLCSLFDFFWVIWDFFDPFLTLRAGTPGNTFLRLLRDFGPRGPRDSCIWRLQSQAYMHISDALVLQDTHRWSAIRIVEERAHTPSQRHDYEIIRYQVSCVSALALGRDPCERPKNHSIESSFAKSPYSAGGLGELLPDPEDNSVELYSGRSSRALAGFSGESPEYTSNMRTSCRKVFWRGGKGPSWRGLQTGSASKQATARPFPLLLVERMHATSFGRQCVRTTTRNRADRRSFKVVYPLPRSSEAKNQAQPVLMQADSAEWLRSSPARIGRREPLEPFPKTELPKGNRSLTAVLGCPWASGNPWPTSICEVEVCKRKIHLTRCQVLLPRSPSRHWSHELQQFSGLEPPWQVSKIECYAHSGMLIHILDHGKLKGKNRQHFVLLP